MQDLLKLYNTTPAVAVDTGYKMLTTLWGDFGVADAFGNSAIQDTFDRAFKGLQYDHKMITELSLVLNWKCWQWYKNDKTRAELYDKLWRETDKWCLDNLKGAELSYYIKTTD